MIIACLSVAIWTESCADPESFVIGGPTLTTFFYSLMRRGRRRFAGGQMMAQH